MRASETEARWRRRVAEWRASGQTAEEFSEGQEFTAGTLRWWSSRLKRKGKRGAGDAVPSVRLAQIVRTPAAPAPGRGAIAVEFLDARTRITIEAGVDPETLAIVLAAIEGGGAR